MCTHINQSLDTICSNINEDISIVNTIQKCLVDTLSKANPAGLNEVSFVDTLPHMLLLDVLNSIETFDKTYEQAGVNYQPGIVPLELHPQLLELCANIKKNGVYLKAKINAAKVSSSKKLDPVNEESNSAATSAVQGSTSSSVSPSNKRSKNKANNKKAEPRVNHNSTDLSPDVLANTIKNIHIDVVADPETTAAPAPSKSSNNHPKKASPKKHVVIMIPEDQLGGHGIGSAGSSGISTTPTDGVLIRLGSDDDELPLPKRTGRKSSANTVPSNTSSDVQSKGKQLAPVAATTVPAAGTISEMKVTASAPKPKSNLAQPITNKSSPSSSGAGVCFAYQRNGVCHKGDSCKFSHVPNDDSKPHPDTHTGSNSTAKHRNPTCVITNIHLDSDSVKMGTTGASTVNTASVIASNSRKTTYVSGNTSILGEIGCVTTDSNPSVRKTRTALKTDVTIKTTRGLVPRPNMGPNINAATIPEAQPASTWKGWIKPQ